MPVSVQLLSAHLFFGPVVDRDPSGGASRATGKVTRLLRALAGERETPFPITENVTFVSVDHDSGDLPTPYCPRVLNEAFLGGTEPTRVCELHREGGWTER